MVHVYDLVLAIQAIGDVEALLLLVAVTDCFADPPGFLVGVPLLHAFLDLVTGVATADRATHGSELLAVTAAHLAADHAADDGTRHCSGNLIRILGRTGQGNHLVVAFLARHAH